MDCKHKTTPDFNDAYYLVKVPKSAKLPKVGTPLSIMKLKKVTEHEPIKWLLYGTYTADIEIEKSKPSNYWFMESGEDFWELINYIDEEEFGCLSMCNALLDSFHY